MPPYDLICLAHLRWDFVYQRPQHLLTRAARDRRVFFIEEPQFGGAAPQVAISAPAPNVIRATLTLPEALHTEYVARQRQMIAGLLARYAVRDYALWYYTPMALSYTRHLAPLATVYDCMDELSGFVAAPAALRWREGELFDRADLVFTGGHSLFRAKREAHDHVHAFPSSVEREHFARARRYLADSPAQASIPHPRVGFYGVVDERIDTDLIDALAHARPDWQMIIIGPFAKINEAKLPQRPNIHYLGKQAYVDLPRFLSGWDAAIMPFARNAATRCISPTKTLEYLAAGLPVISTAIADVAQPYGAAGLVRIADTPADFIVAVEAALAEPRAARWPEADAWLAQTSWDQTWDHMRALLDAAVLANRPSSEWEPRAASEADADLIALAPLPMRQPVSRDDRDGYVASGSAE